MFIMKPLRYIPIIILVFMLPNAAANKDDSVEKLKALDQACETARERRLAPLRAQHTDECVVKWKKERAYCERFYRGYGSRLGNRAPLFYDLPECVTAFNYRKNNQNR